MEMNLPLWIYYVLGFPLLLGPLVTIHELGHYLVSDGGKVAIRCRVRGPSFCNLAVLEELLPGTLLADAVAIIGSTDIVVGETDR